ncbi:unnamed protein product [Gongylonema pulchrum]|uniref:Metallophos domain-containing protein n=1 Tax=Gongylonema pulchrum TaxID=637853 RepID=A0A183EHB0_9BILA|nr:unnamed protein product [Gongylonema pulchrum]
MLDERVPYLAFFRETAANPSEGPRISTGTTVIGLALTSSNFGPANKECALTGPFLVEGIRLSIAAWLSWKRLDEPVSSTALRFVCIADTHGRLGDIVERIPGGDVLIHAGDMTNFGEKEELNKFNDTIDGEDESRRDLPYRGHGTARGYKLLTNCTYLQDCGVKVRIFSL